MKATAILSSDVLDILFENRNKSYGAYILRKEYDQRMMKALMFMMLFAGLVCLLILSSSKTSVTPVVRIIDVANPVNPLPKPDEPKPVKPAPAAASVPTYDHSIPVIVANKDADSVIANIDMMNDAIPGDENKPGDLPVSDGLPGDGKDIANEEAKIVEPPKPVINKEIPRENADVPPSFPGGIAALQKYLERNLQSPETLEEGTVVAVRVKFVVNYDGVLRGFEVLQSGGNNFDDEVLRVLKKMPKWIPGKASGETVSVYYTVPVKFMGD